MTDSIESPGANSQRLLIVGCSARAAAFSACRAGFEPVCVDHFADIDTAAVAQVQQVDASPAAISERTAGLDPMRVIYTGALENSPASRSTIGT